MISLENLAKLGAIVSSAGVALMVVVVFVLISFPFIKNIN